MVIVPVSTVQPFIKANKPISSRQTRSKFYVACTRAQHSIVFAMDNPKESRSFKKVRLTFGNSCVPAYKFVEDKSSSIDEPMICQLKFKF